MSTDAPRDPSAGELDCLAVLWEEQERRGGQDYALGLSEIHKRIGQRREAYGEPPPALSTVSTYLRSALAKQLLVEVRRGEDGRIRTLASVRSRGALAGSRSPQTAYRAALEPSIVLRRTFRAIIDAYPPGKRKRALLDFAQALDLGPKALKELGKVIE